MAEAAGKSDDSDFELDVESDDDLPLAKKKQKSARYVCAYGKATLVVLDTVLHVSAWHRQ